MGLTPHQQRFVELILAGARTQTDCYKLAYPKFKGTDQTAAEEASKLLRHPKLAPIIAQGRARVLEHIAMTAADLTAVWESVLVTDRNEIAEYRRGACRYCHGQDFRYQETLIERRAREDQHAEMLRSTPEAQWKFLPPFEPKGGIGYTPNRDPHPECPNCFSEGEARIVIQDTRKLSPAARSIYEGIDIKNGIPVIKTRSRSDVDDKLAKALGMYAAKADVLNQPIMVYGSLSQSNEVDDTRGEPSGPDGDL